MSVLKPFFFIIAICHFSFFSFNLIASEKTLSEKFLPVVKKGLKAADRNITDLSMPEDLSSRDAFRLSLIDTLFSNPLYTIDVIAAESEFLFEKYNQPEHLFEHISHRLDEPFPIMAFEAKPIAELISKNEMKKIADHPELQTQIENFVTKSHTVVELIKKAKEDIPTDTFNMLKQELPQLFRSDNTDESIRGNTLEDYKLREYASIEKSKRLFSLIEDFNTGAILKAASIAYRASLDLTDFLENTKIDIPEFTLETALGKIIFSDKTPSDYLLWVLTEKSNHINFSEIEKSDFQVLINRGGNNYYRNETAGLGGSIGGIDILIDIKGDDIYHSKSYSQGSGFMGVGILLDKSGNDRYISSFTSQACGAFGAGLLFDLNGNDLYEGNQNIQAVGWVKGYGALVDLSGHDQYLARPEFVDMLRYDDRYVTLSQGIGLGHRPHASGGIGILADKAGNDFYLSDIYGQGSAYWYALGGLVDKSGHDKYQAYQYAQGSGVHLAFAGLIDYGGRDQYISNGVSQGCGHDYAFGFLLDLGNDDDNFVCEGLSQGAGNANGIGLFIAEGGQNGYIAKRANSQGYSDFRRSFGTTGIFADLGENAFFGSVNGKRNRFWNAGTKGTGMDLPSNFISTQTEPEQTNEEKAESTEKEEENKFADETDLQKLFWHASAAPLKFQKYVEPARERLLEIGDEALDFIMQQMLTESVREVHLFRIILPKFGEKATKALSDSLSSENPFIVSRALNLLQECSKEGHGIYVAETVVPFTNDPSWQRRSHAYMFLSRLDTTAYQSILLEGLYDSHPHVRRSAAEGLSNSKNPDIQNEMLLALNDSFQQVRFYAEKYFSAHAKKHRDFLFENVISNADASDEAKIAALNVLSDTRLSRRQYRFLRGWSQKEWNYRAALVRFASTSEHLPGRFTSNLLKDLNDEEHPYVLNFKDRLIISAPQ
ncbi:MAG: HEAT repeat domain-containing protein [Chitinophagaceae bacterium]|nr:MAG: HEAT repeat domain-containing protein [Chitinophagaceae bacterium]